METLLVVWLQVKFMLLHDFLVLLELVIHILFASGVDMDQPSYDDQNTPSKKTVDADVRLGSVTPLTIINQIEKDKITKNKINKKFGDVVFSTVRPILAEKIK